MEPSLIKHMSMLQKYKRNMETDIHLKSVFMLLQKRKKKTTEWDLNPGSQLQTNKT